MLTEPLWEFSYLLRFRDQSIGICEILDILGNNVDRYLLLRFIPDAEMAPQVKNFLPLADQRTTVEEFVTTSPVIETAKGGGSLLLKRMELHGLQLSIRDHIPYESTSDQLLVAAARARASTLQSFAERASQRVCELCSQSDLNQCAMCRTQVCSHHSPYWLDDRKVAICDTCQAITVMRTLQQMSITSSQYPREDYFVCKKDTPWDPALAFIHRTAHPDSQCLVRETDNFDNWFDLKRCPNCTLCYLEILTK